MISGVGLSYKLLAFDQSTAKTGWAFFDGSKLVDYGLINKSKIGDSNERIKSMFFAITEKINELKPDVVIVEGVQREASPAVTMMLARLEGMIIGYLYEHDINMFSVTPTTWRSKIGFKQGGGVKRNELKAMAIKFAHDTFNVDVESDDIADAICIGTAMNVVFEV